MPKEVERKLRAEARAKGLTGDRFRAYVYGGLRREGWKPAKKKPSRQRSRRFRGL